MLPGKYMGAVMFGNGLSGLTINGVRGICLLIFPPKHGSNNSFYGAMVYFVLAGIILVICAVGYVMFARLPYVKYYIKKATDEKMRTFRRISSVREPDHNLLIHQSVHTYDINKST